MSPKITAVFGAFWLGTTCFAAFAPAQSHAPEPSSSPQVPQSEVERIEQYWTKERMRAAKPRDMGVYSPTGKYPPVPQPLPPPGAAPGQPPQEGSGSDGEQ